MGEYEPRDSRVVTGSKTGSGGRWSQPNDVEPERTGPREGETRPGKERTDAVTTDRAMIREHMRVIGADGVPLGIVDGVEGERIKLTRDSSSAGFPQETHEGHHHYLPLGLVAEIEGDVVRLSATAANAARMEDEG